MAHVEHFSELGLHPTLLAAVASAGYTTPTPIQREAIPRVLTGRDLVALAQTGTGKTAAFVLPTLHRMHEQGHRPHALRVLVLAPTRELATQIGESFATYGKGLPFRHAVIFGGVGKEPQVRALRTGVDILVATPGRLLDLMGDRHLNYSNLEVLVLDEADRMLDMGFIHDVRRVVAAIPIKRQTLMFSATMPRDVEELANKILKDPDRVAVAPPSTTVEAINQHVFMVENANKRSLLLHLLKEPTVKRALVFTRTKHGANRVAEFLDSRGVGAAAIHGNKSQGARERALEGFKAGQIRVLVATDIAARGIDIEEITHVIQVDLPNVPEQYVHRIGRTARAGATGVAWAFCASDERVLLRDIERDIRKKVDVVAEHPFMGAPSAEAHAELRNADRRPPRPSRGGGHGERSHGHGRGKSNPGRGGHGHARPSSGPSSSGPSSSGPSTGGPPRGQTRTFGPGRR